MLTLFTEMGIFYLNLLGLYVKISKIQKTSID